MISRRDLLCAGALAPLSTYSFAAPAFKAGKALKDAVAE